MTDKEILKYIDLIINKIVDFNLFNINNILFEYIKPKTKKEKDDFVELIETLKLFGKNNNLYKGIDKGGWHKLTEKGKKLKLSKKSFRSFEKSFSRNDWYNDNWIGYVIALIVLFFSIYQYVDHRSLKKQYDALKNKYENYNDSTIHSNE